ncbi:MAG: ATP-grasp domain-containing protein, partial [Nitrososphaerales archaeon]
HILVNMDGKLLSTYVNKSLEFSDGMPTKLLIESREDVVDLAEEICSKLKFFGVIGFQVFMDENDSKPKLFDLNPRMGNGVILGVAAGCNLPLNAVYLALGKPIAPDSMFARSLCMSRYREEIFLDDSLEKISL